MKIIATKKRKRTFELPSIDFILTIDEIDKLIAFLNKSKQQFLDRQKDSFVTKLVKNPSGYVPVDIISYKELKELGYDIIEDHTHYKDFQSIDYPTQVDIIIHTMFSAEKNADDTFYWVNQIQENNAKGK